MVDFARAPYTSYKCSTDHLKQLLFSSRSFTIHCFCTRPVRWRTIVPLGKQLVAESQLRLCIQYFVPPSTQVDLLRSQWLAVLAKNEGTLSMKTRLYKLLEYRLENYSETTTSTMTRTTIAQRIGRANRETSICNILVISGKIVTRVFVYSTKIHDCVATYLVLMLILTFWRAFSSHIPPLFWSFCLQQHGFWFCVIEEEHFCICKR